MGRCEEAILETERALDLDPLSIPISHRLAASYYWAGQNDRALEQIRKTVELDPSSVPAQSLLAVLLARMGRYDDAIAQAQKCFSLPGPELRARTTLGVVYAIAAGMRKPGRSQESSKARRSHSVGGLGHPLHLVLSPDFSTSLPPWEIVRRLLDGWKRLIRRCQRTCLHQPGSLIREPARRPAVRGSASSHRPSRSGSVAPGSHSQTLIANAEDELAERQRTPRAG